MTLAPGEGMSKAHTWAREKMRRVNATNPCPVCKKPDWCLVAGDGSAAICKRVKSENERGDAGWLHRFAATDNARAPTGKKSPPPQDWPAQAAKFAANLDSDGRAKLAVRLGLPSDALDTQPLLGFNPDDRGGPCYTFAECDAGGCVIGLNRRYADGRKVAMHGSKRGLTLPAGWRDRPGPLFVVEGPTDAAALTAAGLAVIGRPSNSGGVALLARLLRDIDPGREIIVVGENDEKEEGLWPGRDGAVSVSRGLSSALRRPIRWALPPTDAKDVREWLTADARGEAEWDRRGAELLSRLVDDAASEPTGDAGEPGGPDSRPEGPNDGPDNPHRLAEGFLASITPAGSPPLLRYWHGEFHRYARGAYRPVPDSDLKAEVNRWVRAEFVRLNKDAVAAWERDEGENKGEAPRVRPVSVRLIGDVFQALGGLCLIPASTKAPAWLDGVTGPDPATLLAVGNGILDLASFADGKGKNLLPPSPSFFTPTAAPFDFDPNAPEPREWLNFLHEVWPDDQASIDTLQDWFGYLLTPDTRQQKILFLIGPKRGGKGTIARVLRELVGADNVAGPTLGSLATNFGLSQLLGKTVALVADARLSGRTDSAVIVERLLSISGEDALSVDRKFRPAIDGKLPARFVILSNELPRLGDASGALAGRLILLRLIRSWYGKENTHLFDRLKAELPGILLWAIKGWLRLRERGRFVQPQSGVGLVEDMEDLSSPVNAFLRERCWLAHGERIEVSELYREWRGWCETHGRKEPGTEETFGRDLRAAAPSIDKSRPRTLEGRLHFYTGIRLRRDSDPDRPAEGTAGGQSGHRGHSDQPFNATAGNGATNPRGTHPATAEVEIESTIAGRGDHGDQADRSDGRLFDDYRRWLPPD